MMNDITLEMACRLYADGISTVCEDGRVKYLEMKNDYPAAATAEVVLI